MNILTLACALTCFSCIGTAHTIQPSKNYQTEKRSLGDIREVSTLSSIDVVYHQTFGSPYAEIYAPAVRMQKFMLQTMSCPMWY